MNWCPALALPIVLALTSTACGVAPLAEIRAEAPSELAPVFWNLAHTDASTFLNCPVQKLTTTTLTSEAQRHLYTVEIQGCQGSMIASFFGVPNQMTLAWSYDSDIDLRRQLKFNFDEKCPGWAVAFVDTHTRGVTACGRKLVYVRGLGGWSTDALSLPTEQAPTAPPPEDGARSL